MTLACEDTFSKPLENNHFLVIFVFGWIISINLQYPGQNQDWERDREKERGGGS